MGPKHRRASRLRNVASWVGAKARSRLGKIVFRILVALVAATVVLAMGMLWHVSRDLPDVHALSEYAPPRTTQVLDREGRQIGEIFTERRTVVPIERVPRTFVLCVLAAEDADFYEHEGMDLPGLLRAVVKAVFTGRARGTSTITQQVVKLMLLSPERSMRRKVRELILARRLEEELTKDEILHLYLNHINFGQARYGVQEAARYYFGKDVDDLTLAEASLIAGVPQSPTHLTPRRHPEAARRRQLFILDQLERKRESHWPDLSLEDIRAARDTTVTLAPPPRLSEAAPEVLTIARNVLRSSIDEESFARGGYVIHTTIDRELQLAARTTVREQLQALDRRRGYRGPIKARRSRPMRAVERLRVGGTYDADVTGGEDGAGVLVLNVGGHVASARVPERYNPDNLPPSEFAETGARVRVSILELANPDMEGSRIAARLELGPSSAVLVIEPRSRDILVMIGGYDAAAGLNRATQALRQPGSAFKPILYALALKSRRFTPASIIADAPLDHNGWRPRNTADYRGHIRLRVGLTHSINSVAGRLIGDLSPAATIEFARSLGITSDMAAQEGLALGASEVRLLELTNAFATFAAGGRFQETRVISSIETPDGEELALPARPARDVLTPAEAFMITSMLTSVVREGTGRRARRLRRPAGGKTGTSTNSQNRAKDAWFVGYTPELVAGVWVGFDDSRPLGPHENGSRSALPVWVDVMREALQGRPVVEFPVPSGVVHARIDPDSGLLAYEGMESAIDEVFLAGTVPTDTAPRPDVIDATTFLMQQLSGTPEETPRPPEETP